MNTIKRFLIFTLIVLLIPILFLTLNSYAAKVETEMLVKDFPISFPVSYVKFTDDNQSLTFDIESSAKVGKYTGNMYQKDKSLISEVKLIDLGNTQQTIRIIPVDSSDSLDSLNLLERFIFSNHGITRKDDQKIILLGNYEVGQIAFSFEDDGNYLYEIFSSIKIGDIGYIVTTNFTLNNHVDNILNSKDLKSILKYNNIISSIKSIKKAQLSSLMKLKTDVEIDKSIIELNKTFNIKFNSSFK